MNNDVPVRSGAVQRPALVVRGNIIEFPRTSEAIMSGSPGLPLALIGRLRILLRLALLKPRGDFDRACMLISADQETSAERYAAAFFHGLELFALRRIEFYPEQSVSVSNDEMWLARLLLSLHNEDYSSARYLMALRVKPRAHRRLLFLAQGLAEGLFGADPDLAGPYTL